MTTGHAVTDPYASGMLEVGEGHRLAWACSGDPDGVPALYLHGGPGGGVTPGARRFFDPAYRLVVFDQRGCGASTPPAEHPDADLSTNTTQHLVADIETLRLHLGIDRWTIVGASWGTTLALAYAHAHPDAIRSMVLALVTTTSRMEVDWITRGVGIIFPEEWDRFARHVPPALRHLPPVDAYAELLFDDDPEVRHAAAVEWCRWEDTHVSLAPGHTPNPRFTDPAFRLRFARLVTHYWRNTAFLPDRFLLDHASDLDGIPADLIHGRHDVSSPAVVPWELSRSWSTSRLHLLADAGHGGGSLVESVAGALDRHLALR